MSHVELEVYAAGLPRSARPGETIEVAPGSTVRVEITVEVPATDWRGEPNHLSRVELIRLTPEGPRSSTFDGTTWVEELVVPEGGLILRVRGRRIDDEHEHLMFYTNPVRISSRP